MNKGLYLFADKFKRKCRECGFPVNGVLTLNPANIFAKKNGFCCHGCRMAYTKWKEIQIEQLEKKYE